MPGSSLWQFPELTPEKRLERMSEIASAYRIEADQSLSEYDALEVDASIMAQALGKIAAPRPNMTFDPWARDVAQEALAAVSDRVTAMRLDV